MTRATASAGRAIGDCAGCTVGVSGSRRSELRGRPGEHTYAEDLVQCPKCLYGLARLDDVIQAGSYAAWEAQINQEWQTANMQYRNRESQGRDGK